MGNDLLLAAPLAKRLYREAAGPLPIIDFHNHLSVADIAKDRRFGNIAELWLHNDQYKHRAMRICGVAERFITGDAGAREKFEAWCGVFPRLVGNPLYDWANLEVREIFGLNLEINSGTAARLWEEMNSRLADPDYSARGLLKRFGVEYAAPCVHTTDDLGAFAGLSGVRPSLRADDVLAPNPAFADRLSGMTGVEIRRLSDFKRALSVRLDAFADAGCAFSDISLDNGFRYVKDDGRDEERFDRLLESGTLPAEDGGAFESAMLRFLGGEFAARGWIMQLHLGAQRATSDRLRRLAGGFGGFAAIGNCVDAHSLATLLDDIERLPAGLPRTLLITLNPADNAVLSVLSGSFSEDGVQGKVSQGPVWWWSDHLRGMREMLESFAAYSVLSAFFGMTSDARSFLSLVRHDYFRRVLCAWLAEKAARGEFPDSFDLLADTARAMCHGNAKRALRGDPS